MNREEHLQKTFPLEDGTTYIQNLDKSFTCEYSGLPSTQSYDMSNEPKGAGVGGKVEKGNFIDSAPSSSNSLDWMYNWIRRHSGK
jgi:ribosomal protein L10